jgi:endonuclease-3 related protein
MMKRTELQNKIETVYSSLMNFYGPQGWWPVMSHNGHNPTMSGDFRGYHPGDYSFPRSEKQVFEICIGAILTQNTAWTNVEKALLNLSEAERLSPRRILHGDGPTLQELIRPAGYYNQKSGYIANFTALYLSRKGKVPERTELLSCKGIGPETADSMLLYAFGQPEFVIDAYTHRIGAHLKLCKKECSYLELKRLFQDNLPADVILFQEYHALLVEHAKRYYSKKPYGIDDPLKKLIRGTVPVKKKIYNPEHTAS